MTTPATQASRPWEDDEVAGDLQADEDEARHQQARWEEDAVHAETDDEALNARRQARAWGRKLAQLSANRLYMTESRGTA